MRPRRRGGPARAECGSATALVLVLGVALVVVGALGVGLDALLVAHRRAASAADLTALAAASAYQRGGDACGAARTIATVNQARLVSCALTGPVATVRVAVVLRPGLPGVRTVSVRARAGPGGHAGG